MNDLVDMMLLVLGFLTSMSVLLYLLARIDPQTDTSSQARQRSS